MNMKEGPSEFVPFYTYDNNGTLYWALLSGDLSVNILNYKLLF